MVINLFAKKNKSTIIQSKSSKWQLIMNTNGNLMTIKKKEISY